MQQRACHKIERSLFIPLGPSNTIKVNEQTLPLRENQLSDFIVTPFVFQKMAICISGTLNFLLCRHLAPVSRLELEIFHRKGQSYLFPQSQEQQADEKK